MQTWRDRDIKQWHSGCQELYDYLRSLGIPNRTAYGLVERELLHWSKDDLAAILAKVNGIESGLPRYSIPRSSSDRQAAFSSVVQSTRLALNSTLPQLRAQASRTAVGQAVKSAFTQAAKSSYGQRLSKWYAEAESSRAGQDIRRSLKNTSSHLSAITNGTWVKAPDDLIKQSAEEGRALCVNKEGTFSLRDDGYYAISHVWAEGIQGDQSNRGLSGRILDMIFDKLQVLDDVNWLWLDVIAVPSGNAALTASQELQKIDIINSLANVYVNAKAVVIFDALAMQLRSRAGIDVAIALLCGRWINRVWTFQETKLAKNIIILTASGAVPYEDMLAGLRALNGGESWNVEPVAEQSLANKRYRQIYMTLDVLDKNEANGCSIPDVAFSCRHRETGNNIDYVRALFPMLNLQWQAGMTRDDGLLKIYNQAYLQAAQVMTMFGRPRTLNWPGWAPDDLCGLDGDILYLNTSFKHSNSGLIHEWHTLYVHLMERVAGFHNAWEFRVEHPDNEDKALCYVFSCDEEKDATLLEMQAVVKRGKAYFLTQQSLTRRRTSGLFVERLEVDGHQGFCYAVLRVDAFDRVIPTQKTLWTLRNENPMNTEWDGGRARADTIEWLLSHNPQYSEQDIDMLLTNTTSSDLSQVDAQGRNILHKAAAVGNNSLVQQLIQKGVPVDVKDLHQWTALHIAANNGDAAILKSLIDAGAEVDRPGRFGTALNEAVRSQNVSATRCLLEHGAQVNGVPQGDFLWPLIVAHESLEVTNLLLAFGADPNKGQESGLTALHFAARSGNAEVCRVLLEAGAEPSPRCSNPNDSAVFDPLRYAIGSQSVETVGQLLYHGADPNVVYDGVVTPLICAVQAASPKIIRLLLDAGADVSRKAQSLGTALDIAKRADLRLIVKMLTEHIQTTEALPEQ